MPITIQYAAKILTSEFPNKPFHNNKFLLIYCSRRFIGLNNSVVFFVENIIYNKTSKRFNAQNCIANY